MLKCSLVSGANLAVELLVLQKSLHRDKGIYSDVMCVCGRGPGGCGSAEDQQFQNKTALFCGKNTKKKKQTQSDWSNVSVQGNVTA